MSKIQFNNVEYTYSTNTGLGIRALKNVSFSVSSGEYIALVGKNGSGKSTLAKLLNGLFIPTSGKVFIDDLDSADEKNIFEIRKRAGMVFQNPDNQMVATIIEDDVAFGPENIGVAREEIIKRVDWALDVVGMSEFRTRTASRLSGGQKQRVAIAGVLAMYPDILILDESTAMLDPMGRAEIMDIAKKLNDNGVSIINITHNMEEAVQADRIIVLKNGRIAVDGTPKQVFSSGLVEECGLMLPPITCLARELREGGLDINENISNQEEFLEGICQLLK